MFCRGKINDGGGHAHAASSSSLSPSLFNIMGSFLSPNGLRLAEKPQSISHHIAGDSPEELGNWGKYSSSNAPSVCQVKKQYKKVDFTHSCTYWLYMF